MVPLYIVYSCQWASLVSQMVRNLLALQETQFPSLGWEDPLENEWQLTPVFLLGEFYGQRSLVAYSLRVAKSETQLNN